MRAKQVLAMVVVVAFSVASGACYSVKYATKSRAEPQQYSVTNHFFLSGLIGHPKVNLARRCPDGVASAEVIHTFGDMLLAGLTLGLWSPTTTRYRCAAGATQAQTAPDAPNDQVAATTEER